MACNIKVIINPADPKYKQFVLPSKNLDKEGKVIYPKVMYAKSNFIMNVNSRDPRATKLPYYNKIEEFITETDAKAPEGLKNLIQGSRAWNYMPTEKMMVQNAIQGILIAVLFAFVIVLLSTGNIINAAISIFSVSMVIVSITAFFFMNG